MMPTPDACEIAVQQNSDAQVLRLAAYSEIYSQAKTLLAVQFSLTVPAAVVSSLMMAGHPDWKIWLTFYAITVSLLDALVLERIQTALKKKAARIQEIFDCTLLTLPWRTVRCGAQVDTEDVREAGEAHRRKNPELAGLKDWYPPIASRLPLPLARLICQRANCWWDSRLRRRMANWLLGILVAVVVAVFVIALCSKNTVEQMILTVYAPVAPAVLWTVREFLRQRDAADALDKLRVHVERVWNDTLTGKFHDDDLLHASIEIQDMVFDGRTRNALIFNWVNKLIRPRQQVSMNDKAAELVEEAVLRLPG